MRKTIEGRYQLHQNEMGYFHAESWGCQSGYLLTHLGIQDGQRIRVMVETVEEAATTEPRETTGDMRTRRALESVVLDREKLARELAELREEMGKVTLRAHRLETSRDEWAEKFRRYRDDAERLTEKLADANLRADQAETLRQDALEANRMLRERLEASGLLDLDATLRKLKHEALEASKASVAAHQPEMTEEQTRAAMRLLERAQTLWRQVDGAERLVRMVREKATSACAEKPSKCGLKGPEGKACDLPTGHQPSNVHVGIISLGDFNNIVWTEEPVGEPIMGSLRPNHPRAEV